jgi:septum formation protein
MLEDAGVDHIVVRSNIDESALKAGKSDPREVALELAKAKALAVGALRPDDWVIGSDSVAAVEGKLFDKPHSREEAAEHLRCFSDKVLHLTSAVALVRNGSVEASDVGMAELKVRPLTEAFIQSYLDAEWPEVGHCVGVFRIEGRGVQLFDRINGGHFTILGMPLIPLLKALRERELLQS